MTGSARTVRAAALSVVLLAGCAGGGTAPQVTAPQPTTAPGPANATLTITVPRVPSSALRSPRYVSPNSASIAITVLSVNGVAPTTAQVPVNPTTAALSAAGGGNCTVSAAGETCTVPLPAPTGAVTYLFKIMDAAAHVLARNTVTFTIAPSSAVQQFSTVLQGVVASVVITTPATHTGTAFSGPIGVQAYDASGAQITGAAPFANPFTLTDNDATGHTSLTNNGVTGLTVTVGTPNDVVILNYDGAPDPGYTITATVPPG